MEKIIALFVVLIFILSIFTTVTACKSNDDGEKNNSTTIYPIINYLPHYQTYFDDRWVSVRFSELGELEKARRLLLENGVEISGEKRVGFDYRSDEYVVNIGLTGYLPLILRSLRASVTITSLNMRLRRLNVIFISTLQQQTDCQREDF